MSKPSLWRRSARKVRALGRKAREYYRDLPIILGSVDEHRKLKSDRDEYAVLYAHEKHPVVSVTISTFNRSDILCTRTLPSVLNQTYDKFEIVIVGDACTDDTAEQINRLNEPRISFINLPRRGVYPNDPEKRRLVAGTVPMNYCMQAARGLWIAHLDDDDIWLPSHLQTLLERALEQNAEFVSSILKREIAPGVWGDIPRGHSTFLRRSYLRNFLYDNSAWRFGVGADINMLRRYKYAGVRMAYYPEVTAIAPLRPGISRADHLAEDRC